MRRTLVEQALDRAAEYEKAGNKERAEHFLKLAVEAEKIYSKREASQ